MKKMFPTGLLVMLCNCGSLPKDRPANNVSFYSDFDVFKFEGKGPILGNSPVPPCIEVESIDSNKKSLTFWISNNIQEPIID